MPDNPSVDGHLSPASGPIFSIGAPIDGVWYEHLAFSPDGSVIAAATVYGHLRLLDPNTLECTHDQPMAEAGVKWITFLSSGDRVLCDTDQGLVELTLTGRRRRLEHSLPGTTRMMGRPCLIPALRRLALPTSGGVQLWSLDPLRFDCLIADHLVTSVAACAHSPILAVGRERGLIEILDLQTRRVIARCEGHLGALGDLAFLSGTSKLVSCGLDDRTVRVWDIEEQGRAFALLQGPGDGWPGHFDVSPRGDFLAIGDGHTCALYSTNDWCQAGSATLSGPFCFSPCGRFLAYAPGYCRLRLRPLSATKRHKPPEDMLEIAAIAFSPDGSALAAGDTAGTVRIWSQISGKCVLNDTLGEEIRQLGFSSDSSTLSAFSNNDAVAWRRVRGAFRAVEPVLEEPGSSDGTDETVAAFSKPAAAGASSKAPSRQPRSDQRRGHTWPRGHKTWAVVPSGRTIALVEEGQSEDTESTSAIRLWREGKPSVRLSLADHLPRCLAFSADGSLLASGGHGGDGGEVVLWDVTTRRPYHRFAFQADGVTCLAISQNGRYLASGSECGRIFVWDLNQTSAAQIQAMVKTDRQHRMRSIDEDRRFAETVRVLATRAKKEVIPVLRRMLGQEEAAVKVRAAMGLGAVGDLISGSSEGDLISAIHGGEAIRTAAVEGLCYAGPVSSRVFRALTELLESQDGVCLRQALEVIGRQPRLTKRAIRALTQIVRGAPDADNRMAAATILGQSGGICLDVLLEALRDPKASWFAATGLAAAGGEAMKAVAGLLDDDSASVRRDAARCLGLAGSLSTSIRRGLERLSDDPDIGVRVAAQQALSASPSEAGPGRKAGQTGKEDA